VLVLDASVLVAYLDGSDAHHLRAEALLVREADDELAANPLTLAEVLVVPARNGQLEHVQAALCDLEVQELPFPDGTAAKLALLRAKTRLKMPECCVLLTAEAVGARIASFDAGLLRAAAALGIPTIAR